MPHIIGKTTLILPRSIKDLYRNNHRIPPSLLYYTVSGIYQQYLHRIHYRFFFCYTWIKSICRACFQYKIFYSENWIGNK